MASFNGTTLDFLRPSSRPITSDFFQADPTMAVLQCIENCVNNPLHTDMYEDYGKMDADSTAGQLIYVAFTDLYVKAMEALTNKNYAQAVESSSESLEIAEQVRHIGQEKVSILLCRAQAKYELEDYTAAFNDVTKAITIDPRRMDGPLLLIEILTACEDYDKAFNLCMTVILRYEKKSIMLKFVKQAVILAAKVRNGFQELQIMSESNIDSSMWNDVVHELAKEDAWSFVKIILLGTDDITGIEMTLNAKGIHLWGLIDYCDITPWKQWGQKLMLFLLKHGADYETICPKSKSPLHRAMEIGLKSDSFDLLKELFANYIKPYKLNQTNENGNTLLHLACSNKSTVRSTAIKLLLNHHLDVNVKNKAGKMAHQLLPEGDSDRKMIQEIIDKKARERTKGHEITDEAAGVVQSEAKYIISQKWSKARVQKWLAECGLKYCQKRFKQIEGAMLHEFRILQDQSPEVFYQILEQDMRLGFVDILKVSAALRDCLPETI